MLYQLPLELEDSLPGLVTQESGHHYVFEFSSAEIETLQLQACEETIRIITLRCTTPRTGAGSRIIKTLLSICTQCQLIPLAIDVAPAAEGFWEVMGFTPLDDGSRDWVHSGWEKSYQSLF